MITFTRDWHGYSTGSSISTLADTIEARAVSEGAAVYGGTSFPPNSSLDADNNVTGLVGPEGTLTAEIFGGETYALPAATVRITASQGIVGKTCGLASVKCVVGTAITITIHDNATVAAGTVLFAQEMSAGDEAVFPAKLQAINGIWASYVGTATFDIGAQDAV